MKYIFNFFVVIGAVLVILGMALFVFVMDNIKAITLILVISLGVYAGVEIIFNNQPFVLD